MYCIILPRAWSKMTQLTTHFEWFVSSTYVTLCLYFFVSSCSQYLTVHYTFKSNKIYQVIKAGKKYFKKVDHFAPVSPTSSNIPSENRLVESEDSPYLYFTTDNINLPPFDCSLKTFSSNATSFITPRKQTVETLIGICIACLCPTK